MPRDRTQGFTLIEVIISMTILAMLVTVLYYAFSVGLQTWTRQDGRSSAVQKMEKVLRLLQNDFQALRPFTFRHDGKEYFFCKGGPQIFFYVTTNGLGARNRNLSELFFSVLYLSDNENGEPILRLYKNGLPTEAVSSWLAEYSQKLSKASGIVEPSQEMIDKSLILLEVLQEPAFFYRAASESLQAGQSLFQQDTRDMDAAERSEIWEESVLPGVVGFSFSNEAGTWEVQARHPASENKEPL